MKYKTIGMEIENSLPAVFVLVVENIPQWFLSFSFLAFVLVNRTNEPDASAKENVANLVKFIFVFF